MALISGTDGNDVLDQSGSDSPGDSFFGERGNDIMYGSLSENNLANVFYGGRFMEDGVTDNDVAHGGRGLNSFYPLFGHDRFVGRDHRDDPGFDGFGDILRFDGSGSASEPGSTIKYAAFIKAIEVDLAAGTYSAQVYQARAPLPTAPVHVTTGTFSNISQVASPRAEDNNADRLFGSNNRGYYEVFDPNAGADLVDGRGGFDFIGYSISSLTGFELRAVTVDLGKGFAIDRSGDRDTLRNIEGAVGSPLGDRLLGSAEDNIFRPGGFAAGTSVTQGDLFNGRGGTDTVDYAGFGPVEASLSTNTAQVAGGLIDRFTSIEVLAGSGNNDTLTGGKIDSTLKGAAGDDILQGRAGSERLIGGEGTDDIDGGGGVDWLAFEPGAPLGVNVLLRSGTVLDPWGNSDTVSNVENVVGTRHKDLIQGDAGPNLIRGGDGPDNLGGQEGDDTIYGGGKKDSIGGGDGKDMLFGDAGRDIIFGGDGRDTIDGGTEDDQIFGGKEADRAMGGKGDDEIKDSNDEISIYDLVNDAKAADDPAAYARSVSLANWLSGDDGKDKLLGTGYLEGGKGNDTLRGSGVLDGGGGDDILAIDPAFASGGVAYGVLIGGPGNDALSAPKNATGSEADYSYAQRGIVVDGAANTVYAGAKDRDTLQNILAVSGSDFDDRMTDDPDRQMFYAGEGGDDKITMKVARTHSEGASGGMGEDTIRATGDGEIIVDGGAGNDTILVNLRKATIVGGGGNDSITLRGMAEFRNEHEVKGNAGNDTFVFVGSGWVKAEGGAGGDTFVVRSGQGQFRFEGGKGQDKFKIFDDDVFVTIEDFRIGQDKAFIRSVLPAGVTDLKSLRASAEASGDDLDIPLSGGGVLTLENFEASDLVLQMFDL